MVPHAFDARTPEAQAGGFLFFPGQPGLYRDFQDSQCYKEGDCLKQNKIWSISFFPFFFLSFFICGGESGVWEGIVLVIVRQALIMYVAQVHLELCRLLKLAPLKVATLIYK